MKDIKINKKYLEDTGLFWFQKFHTSEFLNVIGIFELTGDTEEYFLTELNLMPKFRNEYKELGKLADVISKEVEACEDDGDEEFDIIEIRKGKICNEIFNFRRRVNKWAKNVFMKLIKYDMQFDNKLYLPPAKIRNWIPDQNESDEEELIIQNEEIQIENCEMSEYDDSDFEEDEEDEEIITPPDERFQRVVEGEEDNSTDIPTLTEEDD
jgi:hypothetical protein